MIEVSPCETHHIRNCAPLYPSRFEHVLPFVKPGLAAVRDSSGSFHIDYEGNSAYPNRFRRTFGFYCGLAAAIDEAGWFHIHPDGRALYPQRYRFSGNFQENICVVRDEVNRSFHIDTAGRPIYEQRWAYVGDYHAGIAAVTNKGGMQTHIDRAGQLVHGCWYQLVDLFHKGFARARDETGWMHIDRSGFPIYPERYSTLEPFYNGIAFAETSDGRRLLIDESGVEVHRLNEGDLSAEVSREMVGYWTSYTLYAATQSKLFPLFPANLSTIAVATGWSVDGTKRLLRALWEMQIVVPKGEKWGLTEKGELLASPQFIGTPAIWMGANLEYWNRLPAALIDSPSHDYFSELAKEPLQVETYHQAMGGYADRDYHQLVGLDFWKDHQKVIDIGGGHGSLLFSLLDAHPHLKGILFDRPEVIAGVTVPPSLSTRCTLAAGTFFEPIDVSTDAIILSRVLHDWDDKRALQILHIVRNLLTQTGKVYIIEMERDEKSPAGGLLDLHMLAVTGGKERSYSDWESLVKGAHLQLTRALPLSPILSILTAEPSKPT